MAVDELGTMPDVMTELARLQVLVDTGDPTEALYGADEITDIHLIFWTDP